MLLQGPMVESSPGDSAISYGVWKKGYKNLKACSAVPYFDGYIWDDLPISSASFARDAQENQIGINWKTKFGYIDPLTGLPSKFVFPGDPVTETGWTMSKSGINPQDVRGMISVGPFSLAKGDTQEIVGGFAIAQGSDRLNSIVLLRQTVDVAREAFLNNFASLPSVTATVDTNRANPLVSVVCKTNNPAAQSVTATVLKKDGTLLAQMNLFDDGAHGDGAAGDKVFANSFSAAPQAQRLAVNIAITRDNNVSDHWYDIADITTTRLTYSTPVILSDNLNENGMANPGENVRFNITLGNPYSFALSGITVEASTRLTLKEISIPLLQANSQFTPVYNPLDTNSFLDFTVPAGFSSNEITVQLSLSDTAGNQWSDSVTFPVFPLVQENAVIQRLRGHSSAVPSVIITDKPSTENANYVIYGIDSVDANADPGYAVKDSASGTFIMQNVPLTNAEFLGHGSPPIDGFKVDWSGAYAPALAPQPPTYVTSDPANFPWFAPGSLIGPSFAYTGKQFPSGLAGAAGSSLTTGDFRNVLVRFSMINGYTDLNGNGKYDVGEPYTFDTLNTSRYSKSIFLQTR